MAEDNWNKTHLRAMPVRPPFSPSDEDIGFIRDMTAPALRAHANPAVLILGMTPRLVQLDWPASAQITAVDASPGMVASRQPHPGIASRALCARWQDMPFDDGAFDAAAGDGSLNSVPALEEYGAIFRELARVLRPGGALVLRCFIRPGRMEAPKQVIANAKTGAFPTTAAFRFRLAMALTGEEGAVGLADLHDAFNALAPDRDTLAALTSWPRADIDRIDVDRNSKVRFTFPTLPQLESLCAGFFAVERMAHGTYTQAAQCPTILFRPANGAKR